MTTEPLLLTLLYAIAVLAAMGAINANGRVRTGISWILALLCLGAAFFHTNRYIVRNKEAAQETFNATIGAQDVSPSASSLVDTTKSASKEKPSSPPSVASPSPEFIAAVNAVQHLASDLATLDPSRVNQVSDAEYLRMQNRLQGCKADAQKLMEQVRDSKIKQSADGEELNGVAGNLAAAILDLEAFFKSENENQEKEHSSNFHKNIKAVNAALERLKIRLGDKLSAVP